MSDKASENILIGMVKEFSEADILSAAKRAVRAANETYFPQYTHTLETMLSGDIELNMLGNGTIWKLMSSKVVEKARNSTNANDGGMSFNINDNLTYYIKLRDDFRLEFLRRLNEIKYNSNVLNGFTGAE